MPKHVKGTKYAYAVKITQHNGTFIEFTCNTGWNADRLRQRLIHTNPTCLYIKITAIV